MKYIFHSNFFFVRFTIDLQNNELCWPHPDILLHVNARYNYSQKNKKNAFVLNNWSNSKWGSEKTVYNRSLPMPGTIFQILIVCHDHHFEIISNETETINFPYRLPIQNARALYIHGDIFIHSVFIENKNK